MDFDDFKEGTIVGRYEIINFLGKGAFSQVFKAAHIEANIDVAIKIIKKSTLVDEQIIALTDHEIEIMQKFSHPFIIEFFEKFEDENFIYIVMELVEPGNCLNYVNSTGKLTEPVAQHYFCEILSAIDYLHNECGLIHRDIKAENVLIDQYNNIRIIDFGFTSEIENVNPLFATACASPAYTAPEVLRGKPQNQESDVWALGVLLFAIVSGSLPFHDENMQRMLQKIIYTEPKYQAMFSNSLRDLIQRMLKKDPENRIKISDIYRHPWILQYNRTRSLNRNYGCDKYTLFPIDTELVEVVTPTFLEEVKSCSTPAAVKYRILRNHKVKELMKDLAPTVPKPVKKLSRTVSEGNYTPTRRNSNFEYSSNMATTTQTYTTRARSNSVIQPENDMVNETVHTEVKPIVRTVINHRDCIPIPAKPPNTLRKSAPDQDPLGHAKSNGSLSGASQRALSSSVKPVVKKNRRSTGSFLDLLQK